MTSINPQNEKILVAFLTALGRQDESLPLGLQQQLRAIGQNLEARIVELPTLAASRPSLYQAYQTALADAQMDEGEQGATLISTSGDRISQLRDRAAQIFTAPDPVQAAQLHLPERKGQVASNPLKRFFSRG